MELTLEQSTNYLKILENKYTFLTGNAGSGKSFLVNYIVDNFRETFNYGLVLAPTGIAALALDGMTIHNAIKGLNDVTSKGGKVDVDYIIIDEVSMVRADLLDKLDKALASATKNKEPFGGSKVVLVGDMGQLPPIVTGNAERLLIKDQYNNCRYFYASKAFKNIKKQLVFCKLEKIIRQKDSKFIDLLNRVRLGDKTVIDDLNKAITQGVEGVILCSTNKRVNFYNDFFLKELETSRKVYHAKVEGAFELYDIPSPDVLVLKEGAKVIVTKNVYKDNKLYLANGTRGEVVCMRDTSVDVSVDGKVYTVVPETWSNYSLDYDKEKGQIVETIIGTALQVPLKLCYAMTIHKAQGATFDSVSLDLSDTLFENGQLYVALSRARDLSGLRIVGDVTREDLKTDYDAVSKFGI